MPPQPLVITDDTLTDIGFLNENLGITKIRFRSRGDGKVCQQCDELDGSEYDANDPNIPIPGPEEEGGDTHWGCRCYLEDAQLGGEVDVT